MRHLGKRVGAALGGAGVLALLAQRVLGLAQLLARAGLLALQFLAAGGGGGLAAHHTDQRLRAAVRLDDARDIAQPIAAIRAEIIAGASRLLRQRDRAKRGIEMAAQVGRIGDEPQRQRAALRLARATSGEQRMPVHLAWRRRPRLLHRHAQQQQRQRIGMLQQPLDGVGPGQRLTRQIELAIGWLDGGIHRAQPRQRLLARGRERRNRLRLGLPDLIAESGDARLQLTHAHVQPRGATLGVAGDTPALVERLATGFGQRRQHDGRWLATWRAPQPLRPALRELIPARPERLA